MAYIVFQPRVGAGLLACVLAWAGLTAGRPALAAKPAGEPRASGTTPAGSSMRVFLAGFQVCSIDEPDEYEDWQITAFDAPPFTRMLLQVHIEEGSLVELEPEGSKIWTFEDDKGKDLNPKELCQQFFSSQIASNGKSMLVVLEASEAPSSGATAVRTQGGLSVRTALKKEKVQTPVVEIRSGVKVTAGKLNLTIGEVSANASGKPSITLSHNMRSASIADIAVIDSSGLKVKTSRSGWGRLTGPFFSTWTHEVTLDRAVDEASFVIAYWSDVKRAAVPFDVRCTFRSSAASQVAE